VSNGQHRLFTSRKLFSSSRASPSWPGLPPLAKFLYERLINTVVLHQVAGPFFKNNPVVIQHPGAASGELPALEQVELR
jgi:hypothetical protein